MGSVPFGSLWSVILGSCSVGVVGPSSICVGFGTRRGLLVSAQVAPPSVLLYQRVVPLLQGIMMMKASSM